MPPVVRTVRASPRWPAPDGSRRDGWEWLPAARPLLDALVNGTSQDFQSVLSSTLADIREAASVDVLALFTVEGSDEAPAPLRLACADCMDAAEPDARVPVSLDDTVAQRVATALWPSLPIDFAVEIPLTRLREGHPPLGWLVALGVAGDAESAERIARARVVLEQVAWVLVLALRLGWCRGEAPHGGTRPHGFERARSWSGLDPEERAILFSLGTEETLEEPSAAPAPSAPQVGENDSALRKRTDDDAAERPRDHGGEVLESSRQLDVSRSGIATGEQPTRAVDENVQFTVYRPRRIPPEVWCRVLAFAHLAERRADGPPDAPDPVEEMQLQARQLLGDDAAAYADTTQDSGGAIPRAGEITFMLDFPDLQVNPTRRSFRWLEDVQREEFHVRAAAALDGRTVRGTLRVHAGALLVAEVALAIRVDATVERPSARDAEADQVRPYRRIFPSYSHLDEAVVRQVEAYAQTLGDEYLRDVTHLRSGEVWSERLADFIREADVFQLFWSRHSMRSLWVRREWEYALSLGRPSFIRPTYWETPMPEAPDQDLPPAALRALHFHCLAVGDSAPAPAPPEPAPAPPPQAAAPPPHPGSWGPHGPRVPPQEAPPAPPASRRPQATQRRAQMMIAALLFVGLVGGSLTWRQVASNGGAGAGPPAASTAPSETPAEVVRLAAVSPDGTRLASMDTDFLIRVRSLHGGEPDLVISTKLNRNDVVALRFSPDGTRVVCETRGGETVEWDARTGAKLARASQFSSAA
jgi:hypothetical protein